MNDLTGQVRYRTHLVSPVFSEKKVLLVLQVEYKNHDTDFAPLGPIWRDATTEDLSHPNFPHRSVPK